MNRKRQTVSWLAFLLALAVFLFSGWKLADYYLSGLRSQNRYEELADMTVSAPPAPSQPSDQDEPQEPPKYQALLEINPHLVGWIQIEDTVIDYPVVQTPDDPEYYLHRDFDGKNNPRGCIFADAACNVESSDNVTIYGHNMKDGSMFAALTSYVDKAFWEEHPQLRFDTLTQQQTYQIFAVFRTTASVGEGFTYHKFVDAANEAEFDAFATQCKTLSLYDTGIAPKYGDRILCLSTCEYTRENGRFVVAAVLQK